MALSSGSRLGPYQVGTPLGAGGMGEVYRARDTNLGRDVALKTLPGHLTHDEERLARFRREAQLLAALNHPHIGAIYGLEEANGQRFLVLELVQGETLSARIARGPIAVDEALAIAREIAEALLYAHEKGIVHRDLKPANIALTENDEVKVLDFGLAKATDMAAQSAHEALNSPTITSPAMMTGHGVILGTAAYMSPEQAKGRPVDKRSDVWAFGCVLFEMLTGTRPFKGEDVSDTLAAVLRGEPDWKALPPSLPPSIRSLLEGCLEKNHRERISDVSTALFALKGSSLAASAPLSPAGTSSRSWITWILLPLLAAAAGATAVALLKPRQPPVSVPVARFGIPVVGGSQLTLSRRAIAVSPDGTRIVYSADGRLYGRSISELETRPVPGGDPGVHPAFSPDGQSIVFWTDGLLQRIPVTGGVPVTVGSTAPAPYGLHWSESGIVFSQAGTGIWRVTAGGGTPEVLVPLKPSEGFAHGPQLLPDGDTLFFTLIHGSVESAQFWDKAEVAVQSLSTGKRKTLVEGGSDGRYLPTGHLAYMVQGTMMGVSLDLATLSVTSGPAPIVEGIRRSAPSAGNASQFEVSNTGVLAYVPGPARSGVDDVFLYDREGAVTALKLPPASYYHPRVSPDGSRIALGISDGKQAAISIYDLSGKNSLRRLTFHGNNRLPTWSADGKRVAFQSDRDGHAAIFWQSVDGGVAERLTKPEPGMWPVPESWSPQGDVLLFSATKGSETTLWMFSLATRTTSRFGDVASADLPTNAVFSPDGRWVAYQEGSSGSGEATLYVQPFPPTGTKYEIGRGGRPMWSRDGKQLFFVPGPSQFSSVSVQTEPTFGFTPPASLPRRFGIAPPGSPRPYDILPDGRIVSIDAASLGADQRSPQIQVVLNWFEELRSKLPGAR